MVRDEAHAALDEVVGALREEFPDRADRLARLAAHMATVHMVIDEFYDTTTYVPPPT